MDTSNYQKFNHIIHIVKRALTNMLDDLGYGDWQVVRANQPTIQALQNETVYFDVISRRRYGVQGSKPKKTDWGGWQMESVWYEEWLIQVSAFKQRDPVNDTIDTMTASDMINLLQGLVNGNTDLGSGGITKPKSYFQGDWINVIRSTDVREIEFETDSGLKDKFPQFDFLLVVEQRLLKNMEKIDTIELETKRI
jgi:hypothetical protein